MDVFLYHQCMCVYLLSTSTEIILTLCKCDEIVAYYVYFVFFKQRAPSYKELLLIATYVRSIDINSNFVHTRLETPNLRLIGGLAIYLDQSQLFVRREHRTVQIGTQGSPEYLYPLFLLYIYIYVQCMLWRKKLSFFVQFCIICYCMGININTAKI